MQTKHLFKKGSVVGIILLFFGVAVAPSINAAAIGTIFDKSDNGPLNTYQSSDVIKRADSIKYPLLFIFVYTIYLSHLIRFNLFLNISTDIDMGIPFVVHPLLFLRAAWLVLTVYYWSRFWNHISDSQGWNWPLLHL